MWTLGALGILALLLAIAALCPIQAPRDEVNWQSPDMARWK